MHAEGRKEQEERRPNRVMRVSEERATMTKKSFKKFLKTPGGWGWCMFQTITAHFSRIRLYEGQ